MPAEAKADALIGTILEGRFHIERLVGEGGMGRVYVADETRLRRRCAIKVLLPELSEDKECVERFLREAQTIAQIHHENVVDIYHLGEDGSGVVFFAMELLTGEDLETRLRDRAQRPISWEQVCQWMTQTAAAMAAVHAAGMIHRDLKPSNIFISKRRDGRDRVKLLDFGIAKAVNRAALTGAGAAVGTPYYMSPEQILALPLDPRSDIYSLGAVFFEALAGRMAFLGEPLQVAMQHCNIMPPRLSEVVNDPTMPPELDELVDQMLAKDASERPQSMEEIEDFLLAIAPGQTSVVISGQTLRPITGAVTGPLAVVRADTPTTSSSPADGMTPPPSALARTALANPLPPEATVEVHLDFDPPPKRRRHLALILGAVALAGAIVTLWQLPRSGAGPGEPAPTVVATPEPAPGPAPTPPPAPVDPQTPPPPATLEPVPTDSPPATEPAAIKPARETSRARKPDRGTTPLQKIARAATKCRKQHRATRGPKITIDYAIGSNGRVTRAVPATPDALGKCLAAAVKATRFPPELRLGLAMDL